MKKTAIILGFLLFTLCSCNSYKRSKFEYRNTDSNVWINTFKSEVFYSCIKEGLKNDSLYKILQKKDLLNMYEGYDMEAIDSARNIGQTIIIKMPKAYIKIDDDQKDLVNKNFISYSCLNYYASRELDSIAKQAYKKHLKAE
nr:hypothetical protein [uncultured Flavobacterium sp.]